MNRILFHIDVNSAFLSWTAAERLKNNTDNEPDLRTIPSIIGGDLASRHGIVLAKSIPAKAYDIHTAEPIPSALRKCPMLTVVPPDHALYDRYSRRMMTLLSGYTPDLEKLSIDECFLDFTPIAQLYDSPVAAAEIIKEDIKTQLGFTVNIGIAPNKVLAKMASDFTKPDRIHTLFPDEIESKMWPLPVDDLYMVGRSSANRLKALGIRTIGELAHTDPNYLQSEFKSHGLTMWEYANGIGDDVIHSEARELKGIGNSVTLREDATTKETSYKVLLRLAETVSERLRAAGQLAQTVTVEIKYSNFSAYSHQMPFFTPTNTTGELYQTACRLFDELWNGSPIRLLGIRTAKLLPTDTPIQMSIFDFTPKPETNMPLFPKASADIAPDSPDRSSACATALPTADKLKQLDAAIDSIRHKYGSHAVVRGTFLSSPDEYQPKAPHKPTE